jgi:N-methylhydantoinase A
MLACDFKHDYVRAYKTPLAHADSAQLRALFEEMSAAGRDTLFREGLTRDVVELRASLDLRYVGQWHELTVAVDLPLDVDAADAAFSAEHDRHFGHASPGGPVEVLAVRLSALGRTEKPEIAGGPDEPDEDAQLGARPVWDPIERALEPTPVWDGRRLPVSSTLVGSAIVELANTTIVVPRDFTLDVDAHGAFAVRTGERGTEPARRLEGVGFP